MFSTKKLVPDIFLPGGELTRGPGLGGPSRVDQKRILFVLSWIKFEYLMFSMKVKKNGHAHVH